MSARWDPAQSTVSCLLPLLNSPWSSSRQAASTLRPSLCSLPQLPDAREVENRLVMLLDFDRCAAGCLVRLRVCLPAPLCCGT